MLSVLIVNWNTRDMLRACLASLRAHPSTMPMETIVVDNASADGSAAMVRTEFPDVILIEPGKNTGYARGNNLAFEAARGEYLLTLNPDTEFEDDTLDRALDALHNQPKLGAVAVRLVGVDGKPQRSVRGFPTVGNLLPEMLGLGKVFGGAYRMPDFDYETSGPAPQPMGSFLLFRRAALAAIGDPRRPFDEQFPIFFNEVDLLYRLDRAGWPCHYLANAHVVHHGGESTKQVRKPMIWESHRSLLRYLRKHARGWERIALPFVGALVWLGALVRARGVHEGFRP